ncbi:MAG: hypothetical protein BJ554DRAFT_6143 [Olpidium bornovanus]|uniref:AGC-kinase C-terminal domain-containing protein n=1 Tax=Olpidium bornovanus TaxID=278681 RepID=A0A8H8DKG1_9FUNG|nr:MAG: hypothetical protein BJ554DRAFT_6143 [Olpidium bornovanus]
MYDRILHERLRFPPDVSPTARSFILSLLERDPARRLGSGANGSQDVKNHPFFEGVDWGKVVRREYRPPFIPGVVGLVGDLDLRNIDPVFASEPIPASLLAEARDVGVHSSSAITPAGDGGVLPLGFSARSAGASSSSHDSLFNGFSFTTPDEEFEGIVRESVPGTEADRAEDEDPASAATTGSGSEEEATDDDDEEEEEEEDDEEEEEEDEEDEEDDEEDEEEGEGEEDDEESDAGEGSEEAVEEDCRKPPAASSA